MIAGLFASAALLKAVEFEHFKGLLAKANAVPPATVPATAATIILLEAAAAAAIVLGVARFAAVVSSILAVCFVGFGFWRISSQLSSPCGCFGDLLQLSAGQSIAIGGLLFAASVARGVGHGVRVRPTIGIPSLALLLSGVYAAYLTSSGTPVHPEVAAKGSGVYLDPPLGMVKKDGNQFQVSFTLRNATGQAVDITASPSCGCVHGSWRAARLPSRAAVSYFTKGPKPEFVLFHVSSSAPKYLYGTPGPDL